MLARIVVSGASLVAAALLVPGIVIRKSQTPLQAILTIAVLAVIFGLVNAYIRPLLRAISLPLNLITFGLFSFVLNTGLLLGAARYLAETRNFAGTACLIFQPAEESGGGGRVMLEDGLLERFAVDRFFGLHNWPATPLGTFAMCEGPAMAASDELTIELVGKGCHAAWPHIGRDPVVAASLVIQAIQALVAREVDPIDNAVISITRMQGGDAYNVVPERAELWGTIRTFREDTRTRLLRRLEEIVQGVSLAQGVTGKVKVAAGYPATVNTAREAALGADVAAEIVGEAKVDRAPTPCMGSEDFAFMLRQRPGSYIWMGTGGDGPSHQLHSPYYDFNDEALPIGVSYWVRLVERLLPAAA